MNQITLFINDTSLIWKTQFLNFFFSDYTFECDFDTDLCGYDVTGVISLIKLPYSIDGTDVTIPTANDTGNGKKETVSECKVVICRII
jgi:hypothetical protein